MARLDKHGSVYVVRSEGPLRAESIGPIGEMIGSKLTGGVPAIVVDRPVALMVVAPRVGSPAPGVGRPPDLHLQLAVEMRDRVDRPE